LYGLVDLSGFEPVVGSCCMRGLRLVGFSLRLEKKFCSVLRSESRLKLIRRGFA
jgi:hypothetical protein